jgi:tetratricopeptide (TPR) repeat protein
MAWKPSNEPSRLDRARAARTDPIARELGGLGLPLIRQRKLNGILNALMMQIEDGGDSPEVNRLLLDALREGLRHQVGEPRAKSVLRAIDAFEEAEAERWEQARAGTLPPIELTPEELLDDLVMEGYDLLQAEQRTVACDKWLKAWSLVTKMSTPDMRTASAFDKAYPGMMQSLFNWSGDLEMELHNAGLDDPVYHERRVRYVNEFLAQFPDEDEDRCVMFRRAEGEALRYLERYAEAEAVYQALIERLPDKGWGYIGWSDQYYWGHGRPVDYDRAEAILLQALDRPNLEDRVDVLDRLIRLYKEWGKAEKQAAAAVQLLEEAQARSTQTVHVSITPTPAPKASSSSTRKSRAKGKKRAKQKRRK